MEVYPLRERGGVGEPSPTEIVDGTVIYALRVENGLNAVPLPRQGERGGIQFLLVLGRDGVGVIIVIR